MRAGGRLQTLHLAPDEARHKTYANPLADTKRTQTLWQTQNVRNPFGRRVTTKNLFHKTEARAGIGVVGPRNKLC